MIINHNTRINYVASTHTREPTFASPHIEPQYLLFFLQVVLKEEGISSSIYYYINSINGVIDSSFVLDKYFAPTCFPVHLSENMGLHAAQEPGSPSFLSC